MAGRGDVVQGEAGAWHGFMNAGTGRLKATYIHAAGRVVQEFKADAAR